MRNLGRQSQGKNVAAVFVCGAVLPHWTSSTHAVINSDTPCGFNDIQRLPESVTRPKRINPMW